MSIETTDLIGAKTVAEKTGWSMQKVYRLTREKRIPHIEVDGRPVYVESEIDTFMADRTEKSEAV